MQGRTTDERDDLDQETTPPKTTNSITRIPHLIWVMGKLSFALYVRKMYVWLLKQPISLLPL